MAYFGSQFFAARYWQADYWNVAAAAASAETPSTGGWPGRRPREWRGYRVLMADGHVRTFESRTAYLRYLASVLESEVPEAVERPAPRPASRRTFRRPRAPALQPTREIEALIDRLAAQREGLQLAALVEEAAALHRARLLEEDELLIRAVAQII